MTNTRDKPTLGQYQPAPPKDTGVAHWVRVMVAGSTDLTLNFGTPSPKIQRVKLQTFEAILSTRKDNKLNAAFTWVFDLIQDE